MIGKEEGKTKLITVHILTDDDDDLSVLRDLPGALGVFAFEGEIDEKSYRAMCGNIRLLSRIKTSYVNLMDRMP